MITSRKLLTYLLQALIHKERTPLATIQNDMEYLASICKNDETNEINTSVKNSISKINNILDNAIFVMNNQDDKKEETVKITFYDSDPESGDKKEKALGDPIEVKKGDPINSSDEA